MTETTKTSKLNQSIKLTKGEFSLRTYLLIVFVISWPFQFIVFFYPNSSWAFRMLLVSMIMVSVGTYVAGKYVFGDTFIDAGWDLGRPGHLIYALGLPLFLWVVPTLIGLFTEQQDLPSDFSIVTAFGIFLTSFLITLIPAFGEEFGWRGYMLPRMLEVYSVRKGLFVQGIIWWVWHWPFLIFSAIDSPVVDNLLLSVVIILCISFLPSVFHAIVFSYFWSISGSLLVVIIYHAAFDEVRDTVEETVGFGPIVNLWQMFFLILLGVVFLYKGNWHRLDAIRSVNLVS